MDFLFAAADMAAAANQFNTFTWIAIAAGFGLALAAFAGAYAQAKAVVAGLEGMARQPEAAGQIQTAMIIGLAFIESLVIYMLVFAIMLNGHLGGPFTDVVNKIFEIATEG